MGVLQPGFAMGAHENVRLWAMAYAFGWNPVRIAEGVTRWDAPGDVSTIISDDDLVGMRAALDNYARRRSVQF